jgi:hypothetical protein
MLAGMLSLVAETCSSRGRERCDPDWGDFGIRSAHHPPSFRAAQADSLSPAFAFLRTPRPVQRCALFHRGVCDEFLEWYWLRLFPEEL